ncbi:unnamed protein product [Chondrus crispus]|uniref:DNA polymerase n=1 Tax=Chondrus crispus TaxID=2769 RepID=R7QIV6_CHOCR|nr:unnamed protein product [Chondrus crispus]CDF37360.1 unnamed protein product [Chondrus crispus]|eukprot:XP_005717179.1 unnamed protein product [Chondrus crispus]
MGEGAGRPEKRRRTLPNVSLPISSQAQSGSNGYLACFDETKPIAVVVSPLKRRQGAILTRNLRGAGACVIEDLSKLKEDAGGAEVASVVVVTDNKLRAEQQIGTLRSPRYVSTKWASAVLSMRSPLPLDPYLLRDRPASVSDKINSGTTQDAKGHKSTGFLPVWCSLGRPDYSDIAQKQALLRNLPVHLCQRSTVTQSIYPSPNRDICKMLEKIAKKRVLEQAGGSTLAADTRAHAYQLASSALKCVPFALKTPQDVDSLHALGLRVLGAVREYLHTGDMHEASMLETDVRLRTLSEFREFYGVGAASARELYDVRGVTSVEQLREKVKSYPNEFPETLVKHLHHFDRLKRLNFKQAETFNQKVKACLNEGGKNNLHLRVTLCGGFRRAELSGHDVDLLYCRRQERADNHDSVLASVARRLSQCGLLVSVLSLTANEEGWHERRYHTSRVRGVYRYAHDILHGLAVFEGCVFRVDVVGVRDAAEFPFATLAWSGSTVFQRDLRLYCEKKGWIFNQHGIFERDGGHRVKLTPGPKSEMDVFEAMGLTYRPPFERSC